MFDNTITIARDGTNIVLVRMNQDQYSSEYKFRDATHECRLFIRHNNERVNPTTGVQMERHNVLFEREVYTPAGQPNVLESVSATIRFQKAGDPVSNRKTALAALAWLTAPTTDRVIAWES